MSQNNIEKLIGQKAEELEHVMKVLPMRVGNEAVNFSIQRFRSQNWKDKNKQPWKQRKFKKSRGRAILVQSGRLRRSIRIMGVRKGSVIIGTDVPYAQTHNEGFKVMRTLNKKAR